MKLAVFSHKEVWRHPESRARFVTVGGFPAQMRAVSELFDATEVFCLLRSGTPPDGYQVLEGHHLTVSPRREPLGRGHLRKAMIPVWLIGNGWSMWKLARRADAVHPVLLGDIGGLGLILGLLMGKPIFARHCGMWTYSETMAARIMKRLLVRVAGGSRVVMATGGGAEAPESGNPAIQWIFATSLTSEDMRRMPRSEPWRSGEGLRLISVGRLSRGKNFAACIEALPAIRERLPGSELLLVGDGEEREELQRLAIQHGVADAVEFVGNRSRNEVFRYLASSHLFLFPSAGEGFPKAVLEAMACGLPVVASGVSVLPHLLADDRGVVLPGVKPDEIATAVVDLANTPDRMKAMGRRAHEAAQSYTLECWRDLIGERLGAAWGQRLKAADDRLSEPSGHAG